MRHHSINGSYVIPPSEVGFRGASNEQWNPSCCPYTVLPTGHRSPVTGRQCQVKAVSWNCAYPIKNETFHTLEIYKEKSRLETL